MNKSILQVIIRDKSTGVIHIFEDEISEETKNEIFNISSSTVDKSYSEANELWYVPFTKKSAPISEAMKKWYQELATIK